MRRTVVSIAIITVFTLAFALPAFAVVPPPPVNQTIGIPDGIFNDLVEAECRFCHEDPDIATGGAIIPDRHHLLMYSPIQTGLCSAVRGTCSVNTTEVCYVDSDCPTSEICNLNYCLQDSDCNPGICSRHNVSCTVDSDCPQVTSGETCGEYCIGETVAPDKDADKNGVSDTLYQCLNCHLEDTTGGIITMQVWRDCLLCHVQIPGEASVHHLTATAQGTDSPIGDPDVGDCTPCHGTLVNDIGDGHYIPTYAPSLVTPNLSGGNGLPLNARGNGAGACNYCHDQDTTPPAAPVEIYRNADTHHNTGVFKNEVGVANNDTCFWCHDVFAPNDMWIRVCEGCHGLGSLHNIQADSDNSANIGSIIVGGENPGYGHVGHNDDCWGCHGFSVTAAEETGPLTPFLYGTDTLGATSGYDTTVTLVGSTLTNLNLNLNAITSNITLTGADGSVVVLTPDSVTSNQLSVTIPAATAPGNYALRAVKGPTSASNPIVISVKPEVAIASSSCDKKKGILSVSGSGFGEKPAGSDAYINVEVNGQSVNVTSWSDTKITASVSGCSSNAAITVNALMGSATSGSSGKPAKPCSGKKCN